MNAGVVQVYNGALAVIRFKVAWPGGSTPWSNDFAYSESHSFTLSQYGCPEGQEAFPQVEVRPLGSSVNGKPTENDDSSTVAFYSVSGTVTDLHITPPGPAPSVAAAAAS